MSDDGLTKAERKALKEQKKAEKEEKKARKEEKAAKKAAKEGDAAASPSSPTKASPAAQAAVARCFNGKSRDDPEDYEANREAIEAICNDGLNQVCTDCGMGGTRWAVVNHGIFVCIRCSGIHRSLGTHISKVKSSNLDKWARAEISVMMAIGNSRAKNLFEHKIPKGTTVPKPESDDNVARAFIIQKYEDRAFAAPDHLESLKKIFKNCGYKTGSKLLKSTKASSAAHGSASLFSSESKKKKKKQIFGAFGLVTVEADKHDALRAKLLAAFGVEETAAAAATSAAADDEGGDAAAEAA